jgi:hypothetical protein
MTVVLAKCLRCGTQQRILEQNYQKHNRKGGDYCQHCIKDTFHHLTGTPLHSVWVGMRRRARDESDKNYGGRGIGVSPEWEDFSKFYEDMAASYQEGLWLERIDVNKGYSKKNCTWTTPFLQQANKRTNRKFMFEGEEMHLAELCRRTGLSKIRLTSRLSKGMSVDEAVRDARNSTYGTGRNTVKDRMGRLGKSGTSTTLSTAGRTIAS